MNGTGAAKTQGSTFEAEGWTVRLFYNPDPTEFTREDFMKIKPVVLPLSGT
jgi:hypothetical protein